MYPVFYVIHIRLFWESCNDIMRMNKFFCMPQFIKIYLATKNIRKVKLHLT